MDIAIRNDLNPEANPFLTESDAETNSDPDPGADSEELSHWLQELSGSDGSAEWRSF